MPDSFPSNDTCKSASVANERDRLWEAAASLASTTHRAGTLSIDVLKQILDLLPDREIFSVETGCGKSTIFLSNVARHHTVFCYDDRALDDSSVRFVICNPYFVAERTTFVFGPTQETLPRHSFLNERLFDLALIDGPHGYPFPDLEFWHLYPHLGPGALLVIDDLMIPSISRMYDILREDRMFNEVGVFSTTGILRRSSEAGLPRNGDHWWEQAYNYRRFPLSMKRYTRGHEIVASGPIDFSKSTAMEKYCLRGFDYRSNEGVITIDTSAILRFQLAKQESVPTRMIAHLRMEAPEVAQGREVLANGHWIATISASRNQKISAMLPSALDGKYEIEFRLPAAIAAHDKKGNYDFRRYGALVQEIELQAESSSSPDMGMPTDEHPSAANSGSSSSSSSSSSVSDYSSRTAQQLLASSGQVGLSAESSKFNAVLSQLVGELGGRTTVSVAVEVTSPPVLCPRPDSPVRFIPLGPGPIPLVQGLGPLRRWDGAWTFVDFAAFEGVDFAYAVYRSLLHQLPPQRKIRSARKGSVERQLLLLLEADRKARSKSDVGRLAGLYCAKGLYLAWRVSRKLRPIPLARILRFILRIHARMLYTRHYQAIVQRRVILASLQLASART